MTFSFPKPVHLSSISSVLTNRKTGLTALFSSKATMDVPSVAAFALSSLAAVGYLQKEVRSNSASTRDGAAKLPKEQVSDLRKKHMMKCVSVSYANSGPLMILRGESARLYDETEKSFLDTRNNVSHVGHENPYVVNSIQKQVATLNTNARYLHPNVAQLAKRLTAKFPDPLEVVVFVNSGSEANDLALRMARAYTKSKNTIVVDGAYHGHTCSLLEISPYKYEHSSEVKLVPNGPFSTPGPHIWKVPCPDTYRGQHRGDDAGAKYAGYVEEACDAYKKRGESVGAFIIESGMSVAGVILPPKPYLKNCAQAVRNAGGVYIADEVQTGFGRLGSSTWAFQHGGDDVVPDIVTVGKPFGNGMPLGALITTRAIAENFSSVGVEYFNTFGGNPVCAAAGLAVLDVIEKEGLQQHALTVGNYLQDQFRTLQKRLDIIGEVRGSGLFVGIDLVRDRKTREPATAETSFLCTHLKQEYDVLSSIDGLDENVLVVKPPLTFSKADVDSFINCFERAVEDLRVLGDEVRNMSKTPT